MTFGSLFAGIGGFDLGLERAGMEGRWQVELDPKCREVLARHFPGAARFDDITTVGAHNLEPVDVICGGFPCQDLSVAGKRAGLAGARSGLFFEMARVCDELQPSWILWENVPGLLSSPTGDDRIAGADFLAVLAELDRLGYVGAWTTVDARYFGLAQRRERVFGAFTRGRAGAAGAAEVFALAARLRGNPPPRRQAGKDVAGTFAGSSRGGGFRNDLDSAGAYVPAGEWPAEIAPTLNTAFGTKQGLEDQHVNGGAGMFVPVTANALEANDAKQSHRGDGSDNLVVGALHTASGRASTTTEDAGQIVVSPAVTSKWAKGSGGPAGSETGNLVVPPLAEAIVAKEGGTYTHEGSGFRLRNVVPDGLAPTLRVGGRGQGAGSSSDNTPIIVAGTLRSNPHNNSDPGTEAQMHIWEARFARNGRGAPSDLSPPLKAESGSSGKGDAAPLTGVRRLTPLECERLQGFPEGWTAGHADTHRYRMLGNAVAVPCAAWIAQRLVAVEAAAQMSPEGT